MNPVIVFENEHFVVCDKPALCLTVPDRHKSDRPCLGTTLQKKIGRQIFPVHRLDFEVSGLVLFAKNNQAHTVSQDWFYHKEIRKQYRALSEHQSFQHWPAHIPTDRTPILYQAGAEFSWKMQIMRGKKRSFESVHGEWALTEASMTAEEGGTISWNLFPLTGKPHQLRLEMSRHGFAILGDQLYGSSHALTNQQWKWGGIALRAVQLDLTGVSNRLGLPEKIEIDG